MRVASGIGQLHRLARRGQIPPAGDMAVPDAEERIRVLYWFKQPTPYAVARFNAAAERPELDFHAVFSEVRQPDRSWAVDESAWRFPASYLGAVKVPLVELIRQRPDVFLLEYDRWNLALGAVIGLASARRVAFRVLPNFDAWSHRTWWREAGKHLLFHAIDGAKVPGPDGAALAVRYGLPPDRAAVVTQSIDVAHYGRSRDMSASERAPRREELGLAGCVFVYVGRVWAGKGLDELFAAYRQIRAVRDDVSLLVIGDGVDYERYVRAESSTPGVKFAGFIQPADLPEWYALCDVLVFPTHGDPNGLVVEEALAAGLPVIASDAAGDIGIRVPPSVGRVFPVGDLDALVGAMTALTDPAIRERMASQAPGWVAGKNDQHYAEDLVRFVEHLTMRPRRRSPRRSSAAAFGRVLATLAQRANRGANTMMPRPEGMTATHACTTPQHKRICVVGPGTRFLSGITYYTYSLIGALTQAHHTCSALFIRNLVPAHLYPGRERVGQDLCELRLPEDIRRMDGIDWYWGWSIVRAMTFLCRERPQVLILQWWTGAVLHTYLLLAALSRMLGTKVVIEFHEAQDVGEARLPLAAGYMNIGGRCLLKLSAGRLVHSEFDRELINGRYGLNGATGLIAHAGYDYLPVAPPIRVAPPGTVNLFYFGVIRPFKGVEDLITAFDLLGAEARSRFWLTIVGETWEGWDLPNRLIAASPYRDRITLVNRYVTDAEAAGYFAGADLVVLPYHRSSSSGPLQIAMAKGLPVVVPKVGGLVEATARYSGTVLVEAADPVSLAEGIKRGAKLAGRPFRGVSSWDETVRGYSELLDRICT